MAQEEDGEAPIDEQGRVLPVEVEMPRSGILVAESVHDTGFEMEHRRDDFHKILCVVRGRSILEIGDRRIELGAGDFRPVRRGDRHRLEDRVAATVFLVCIDEAVLRVSESRLAVWNGLTGAETEAFHPSPGRLADALGHLRALLRGQLLAPSPRRMLSALSRLDALLVVLADSETDGRDLDSVSRIARFVSELPESVHREWRLEHAARACGLSVRRFTQLFRESQGVSFHDRLTELRVSRCCDDMREGLSIDAAAFAAGFGDLSSCYRAFSRVLRVSPGAWRAAIGSD